MNIRELLKRIYSKLNEEEKIALFCCIFVLVLCIPLYFKNKQLQLMVQGIESPYSQLKILLSDSVFVILIIVAGSATLFSGWLLGKEIKIIKLLGIQLSSIVVVILTILTLFVFIKVNFNPLIKALIEVIFGLGLGWEIFKSILNDII